jgi:hypothetical protein
MKPFKVLATISTLVLLAGCGMNQQQQAQQQAQQANAWREAVKAHFQTCNLAVNNETKYARLQPHNYPGAPPASELANETLPTPEEAHLMVARWDEDSACRAEYTTAMSQDAPGVAQIWNAYFAAVTETVAHFSQRHMTWAALAKEFVKLGQDGNRQLAAYDEIMRQRAAQEAEARRQNGLAAAAILGATMPRPPQTIYVAPCTINAQIARVC